MPNAEDANEFDWAEFAEEVKRNHRPHAGHFSWETNRAVTEFGVFQEFQNSLAEQKKLFFREPMHRGDGNDPPDCEAIGNGGKRVGIEITELVDAKSAAAARAGKHYDWKDWKDALIPELQKILLKKDAPSDLKEAPYQEYVVLIFSDEPWMEYDYVERQLAIHHFRATEVITRAFLLLSYSPFTKGYPCFELQLSKEIPATA
jgi:hypothetical protein